MQRDGSSQYLHYELNQNGMSQSQINYRRDFPPVLNSGQQIESWAPRGKSVSEVWNQNNQNSQIKVNHNKTEVNLAFTATNTEMSSSRVENRNTKK